MIHYWSKNKINIVLDAGSGAVHVVDDLAYQVITRVKTPLNAGCPADILEEFGNTEQIKNVYGEIYELFKNGLLFSDDDYSAVFNSHKSKDITIKALCLHIAHDCNLKCAYCFASQGDFNTGKSLMAPDTAKKAIDFVVANSGKRRNIEIDFFGGEPLMAFDTVLETVQYARGLEGSCDKKFRFTITTNGLLLDDAKIAFINREMSNVVLSLDGRREIHDKMRMTVTGEGSYDLVLPKMKRLIASRPADMDYFVRGTYTKYNIDFTEDIKSILNEGFSNISVEPVVTDENNDYALLEEDVPAIMTEYDRLCDFMVERKKRGEGFTFFHFMIDLSQGPCIIKRIKGCGAGCEYLAVTPEGDLYPCHQFVGNEDFKIGNLKEAKIDLQMASRFQNTNIFSRKKCERCWAKYYCSGGCSAANFHMNHNMDEPYSLACELEKKRIECAIYLKACDSL